MPPLTLPKRTRGTLRAFWLVASSGLGLAAGSTLAAARRDKRLLAVAVPLAAIIAIPGMREPQTVQLPYKAWNRLGRVVGDLSSAWVTRVAYGTMLLTRRIGDVHDIPERSPGSTGWVSRSSQVDGAYRYQDTIPRDFAERDAFDRYARQPGHEWAESLRPLVRLLGWMETDADVDDTPPTDVYTLY